MTDNTLYRYPLRTSISILGLRMIQNSLLYTLRMITRTEERKDPVNPEEFKAPAVSRASQAPSSSGGFTQVVSVTAEMHKNIIVHDGSSDLYSDLMGDLGDDN